MNTFPRLGVLAVCVYGDHVVMVKRRNPPDQGLWGFPGGKVEWGETVEQGAVRELHEETGIIATARAIIDHGDAITRDGNGDVIFHYHLIAVLCDAHDPQPISGDDAEDAALVHVDTVLSNRLAMSAGVDALLTKAIAQTGGLGGRRTATHRPKDVAP
ncbi:hypothetical protein BFP70_13465 [Thioclava sp. SK-1]|uniref:NUDIX hydrolase n=1 Tax=Thioclava sp. SK-1 TaxID=1889770 RepID=UPI000826EA46|nr:NUDIX hydrolase [Thioclava sp. SK-1]OCX62809.1 hypothetical protein BFP70_13465 [Thioclava sp. SK-1]